MTTKSINIDPNILLVNGKTKSRKNNATKKNNVNIPIKNTDIYTLITSRIKNKTPKEISTSTDPIIDIKNDIEYVQKMLHDAKSKKGVNNKTRKTLSYNVDAEIPWGNMKNGLKKTFREWKKTSQPISQKNNSISFKYDNIIESQSQQPITIPQQPITIPQQPITIPQQPITIPQQPITIPQQPITIPQQPITIPQQPVTIPQQPITISQQPITISQQPITIPQQPIAIPQQPITPIPNRELSQNSLVPIKVNKRVKKTIHNKYKLGKHHNKQSHSVGILLKTPKTRKTIIDECKKLKDDDITQIKSYLRKRGFIKEGSIAPPNVIKEIYCSVKTTGDVNNINKEYTLNDLHSVDLK